MSEYTPHRWVIVEIDSKEHGKIRKVLGSWYGGYAGSDSWRMSSGVTEVIEHDNHYEVHNHSGSIYTCYKGSEGMSGYTDSVLADYKNKLDGVGTIEVVPIL
jgi:hypothetical protein